MTRQMAAMSILRFVDGDTAGLVLSRASREMLRRMTRWTIRRYGRSGMSASVRFTTARQAATGRMPKSRDRFRGR